MLNWIAIYGGQYLIGLGGPLADEPRGPAGLGHAADRRRPTRPSGAQLQARAHRASSSPSAARCCTGSLLNRTTLGYEVRAVGFNPEAARYGGVSVRRSIILAMAISGAFAGLAGAGEVLGVQHRIAGIDIPVSTVGFTGIAVALLGPQHRVGIVLAALLFAVARLGRTLPLGRLLAPSSPARWRRSSRA